VVSDASSPESVAKRTLLRPESVEEYLQVHSRVPDEVGGSLRAAGVIDWRIWLSGEDLFHVIDVDSRARMRERLRGDPVMARWSERIGPLLVPTPHHDADMRQLWSLRDQLGPPG
jgi:L-rhamnose mutarotase